MCDLRLLFFLCGYQIGIHCKAVLLDMWPVGWELDFSGSRNQSKQCDIT